MAQLPTAGGKTVVFAAIVREFVSRGEGVLVLAHRKELVQQAASKIRAELPRNIGVGVIKAGIPPAPLAPVQVASVQTLVKRRPPNAGLVIIDECHHATAATYQAILSAYPHAFVLGVTATPCRTDGTGFDDIFDILVLGPSVAQMLADGYLCPVRILAPANQSALLNMKGVKKKSTGDYSESQVDERVDRILGAIVPAWQEYLSGKSTLVFTSSIKSAESVAEEYRKAGIRCEVLTGKTPPKERDRILKDFENRKFFVLINCGVITEGTDIPIVEAIQCLRPTTSLALWLQILGRAMRLHPSKTEALVLDHTENWIDHGRPEEERIWTLEGVQFPESDEERFEREKKEVEDEREREIREEFEQAAIPLEVMKFVDVSSDRSARVWLSLATWKGQQKQRGCKPGWVVHRFKEKFPDATIEECGYLRRVMGFKHGWEKHFYKDLQTPVSREPLPIRKEPIQVESIVPSPELDQLWQEVLIHVQPPATKMMLSQMGILVSFDGQNAVVGIPPSWVAKFEARINAIEAAFQQHLQRSVTVSIRACVVKSPYHDQTPPSQGWWSRSRLG
jgi:superfamily II DNA or RNA helicase